MKLEELISPLQSDHFYPQKEMKGEKLVGLKIESPEILMQDRIALVQKIVGEEFDVKQIKGEWNLRITEKKKAKKS